MLISIFVGYAGWTFSLGIRGISPGLEISMLVPTLAIPVGMTLIGLASLLNVIRTIQLIRGRQVLTFESQTEHMDGGFKPAEE
jgi:TRAP-type C4-dicarboxylate transport system permease small subunit